MILIDEEFKNLIPPLSDEEFKQLEENCLRDGVRDPLVVWPQEDGHDILIDGHNRWSIIRKHGGLPFDIKRMEFDSRGDARAWIIANQIGRRNLNSYYRGPLALELEDYVAEKAKGNERKGGGSGASGRQKSDKPITTTKELAKIAGVSHDTIHKIKIIEEQGSDLLKQQARAGEISINKAYRVARGYEDKSPAQAQKEYLNEVQARHDDFTEKSKEGVVSVAELKADKDDRQVLAREFYTRCLRMGERIDALMVDIKEGEIDTRELLKTLDKSQRAMIAGQCDRLITALTEIKGRIKTIE